MRRFFFVFATVLILTAPVLAASPFLKAGDALDVRVETSHPLAGSWSQVLYYPDAGALQLRVGRLGLGLEDTFVLMDGFGREIVRLKGSQRSDFWLPPVPGDTVRIEVTCADGSSPWGLLVTRVGYFYGPDRMKAMTTPESICGVDDSKDAVCYQTSDPVKWTAGDAVARFSFVDPINGSGYCSGFLISPYGYFMTCNHCIATEDGANSMAFNWHYDNQNCGSGPVMTGTSTMGAHLVATDVTLDYAVVAITDNRPQDQYGYLTPNPAVATVGETIWIAGHPLAYPKKFSIVSDMDGGGNGKIQLVDIAGNANGTDIGYYLDTQGGSSGSPVMLDSDNSVVALHHFGILGSTCTPSDMNQGVEMSKIYPQISAAVQRFFYPTASVTSGTSPLQVTFSANILGGTSPYTFDWDFGDGSAHATEQNPVHTYTSNGTYTVTLAASDSASHSGTDNHLVITVAGVGLVAQASASPTSGSAPLAIAFTGTASGGTVPYTFSWSFGDGTANSTDQNPSHTYTAQGGYFVVLTVQDSTSATASDNHVHINVSGNSLTAQASASPTSGSAPLAVAFTGTASGGTVPYTYSWSFGDGASSTSQNPSHTYTSAGTFTAALTVHDSVGASGSDGHLSITVTSSTSLQATASASPTSGTAPLAVAFTGSASGGTAPYTYAWTFGDGATSTTQNPGHTYASAGTFAVALTIHDSVGASASDNHLSITVTSSNPLQATASASPISGIAPLTVAFTGSASGGTAPYTYAWTFGDNANSTSQNPSHTYTSAGAFAVGLIVHDAAGASASDNHLTITVSTTTPPVITGVAKMTDPFRLKITGSNFHPQCTVLINGNPVPTTTWKSVTQVIAKKESALKNMVPQGTAVQIVLRNDDDGAVSAAFSYTRPGTVPGETDPGAGGSR